MSEKIKYKEKKDFEKISSVLSNIENNISELSKYSSGDFIMLNKYLKNQYNRIGKISENVKDVFDLRSGKDSLELLETIRNFADDFYSGVKSTNSGFDTNSELIKQIISYMNLLYIPYRNYNQNVVTVNFLTNSLKLNLIHIKKLDNDIFDPEIKEFEKIIKIIKQQIPDFDKTIYKIKKSYKNIAEKTGILRTNNLDNFEKAKTKINSAANKLDTKIKEGNIKIPRLDKIKKRYAENINNIVVNLQYSDIINQKIQHISEANLEIIKKIDSIKEKGDNSLVNSFLLKVKDIADLQTAQLIKTNKEYQNAIKIIAEKFVEIGVGISNLIGETVRISGINKFKNNKNHDFYNIDFFLKEAETLIKKFVEDNTMVFDDINIILEQLKNCHKIHENFEKIHKKLCDSANIVVKKAKYNFDEKTNTNDITRQFTSVMKSLKNDKNYIKKYYKLCEKNKKLLQQNKLEQQYTDLNNFTTAINNILKTSKINNIRIYEIINETINLEKIVSDEINAGIKNIKYYDIYEKTAGKIIMQLQELYNDIELEHKYEEQKLENLRRHKDKYTMKSERDVHEKVTGIVDNNNEDKTDEDEVEFF